MQDPKPSLKRRLCEAEFDIEIQYALLGLLLIFQAVIPAMQAAVENEVPIPGPSLSATAIWDGDLSVRLRIGEDVMLAEARSGRLCRLDKEFPHSTAAKNFTFKLNNRSSGNLCCWLGALPDLGTTTNLAHSQIRVLIFKSSIANKIERAIDSGNVDLASLPPDVFEVVITPGQASNVCIPLEFLDTQKR